LAGQDKSEASAQCFIVLGAFAAVLFESTNDFQATVIGSCGHVCQFQVAIFLIQDPWPDSWRDSC
jgi:hypothetical protein